MANNPNVQANLTPFAKGNDDRRNMNGRPRKYVSLLKEQGYKLSEINDTIQAMMSMDLEELNNVWNNNKATILEKTIAGAMVKSLKNGSLYSLDTLMNRVFGKPKEQVDVTSGGNPITKIEVEIIRESKDKGNGSI